MATTKLRVPNAVLTQRLRLPDWVDAKSLAANTAESYTVPAGVGFIVMTGSAAGFYINGQGTASAPADTSDGTASFWIPSSAEFVVDTGDVISIMPLVTNTVTIACYSV